MSELCFDKLSMTCKDEIAAFRPATGRQVAMTVRMGYAPLSFGEGPGVRSKKKTGLKPVFRIVVVLNLSGGVPLRPLSSVRFEVQNPHRDPACCSRKATCILQESHPASFRACAPQAQSTQGC